MADNKNFYIFIPVSVVAGITGLGLVFIGVQEVGKINDGKKTAGREDIPAITQERDKTNVGALAANDDAGKIETDKYSRREYPLESSMTGALEGIAADKRTITVAGDQTRSFAVTPTTEVFRNGERASLADIKTTDVVTVLGRKKTEVDRDAIADTIYAVIDQPEPPAPMLLPAE
jgi:Cu/Ag efflux protein CusF